MKCTINTVQEIAMLLAGYDVEKVAEEEHGGELPEGMTTALRKLEQNLRVYKAYLPVCDLKLHPGVRSSRNSMKVLTARTDVSYLRDYKTGGEEGYAGRFCAFRVFLFFSNPASPISPVHSLCLSVGVCGTSPSPQGLNAPALFYASSPWQGI